MQQTTLTLTSAQILNLHATPVEIVPAPGPNRILVPISISAKLHFGGTAYLLGDDINLLLGAKADTHQVAAIDKLLVESAADENASGLKTAWAVARDVAAKIENVALSLSVTATAYTTGNGTLTVTVFYGTGKSA